MKYTTIIGVLLIGISVALYFVFDEILFNNELVIGFTAGSGIGFFFGGLLGWMYKKRKVVKAPASSKTEETLANNKQDDSGLK